MVENRGVGRPSTACACANLPYLAGRGPVETGLRPSTTWVCTNLPFLAGPSPRMWGLAQNRGLDGASTTCVNHVSLYQSPLAGREGQRSGLGPAVVQSEAQPAACPRAFMPRTSGWRRSCTQAPATIYQRHKIGFAPLLHRPRTRQYAGIPWRIPVQRCTSLSRGASPPPSERASRPHLWASF